MIQPARNSLRLPILYAGLIIFALLPQFLGDSSVLSIITKIGVLLYFTFRIIKISNLRLINKDFLYFVLFIANTLVPFFVNGGNLFDNFQYIFVAIITYFILYVAPRKVNVASKESINRFFKIFAHFILISCIYNMIINFNSLTHITSLNVYSRNEVKSFFDNKNTFGFFLMYGVFSSAILRVRTRNSKWLFYIGIMILNELMAMSRSAIIVSLFVVLLITLGENANTFKKIIILLMILFGIYVSISSFTGLNSFLTKNLFGNVDSMERRVDFVRIIYPNITGLYRIFGFGISRAKDISVYYTGILYFHNTFFQYFVEGGYIKVFILLYWLLSSLKSGFNVRKYNKQDGNICIVSVFMYTVYSFVESVALFSSPVLSITATIFVVTMPTYLLTAYFCEEGYSHGDYDV